MDSVGIPWNSDIPVGIQQILPELIGESKDLNLRTAVIGEGEGAVGSTRIGGSEKRSWQVT